MQLPHGKLHHMFLSHDWKTPGNHERVRELNEALMGRRMVTWFDEQAFSPGVDIVQHMCNGIESSDFFVVFITQNYLEKVAGSNSKDNCQKEFKYAESVKGAEKMIPVVMEPELKDTAKWFGPVGMNLSGKLYVDFSPGTLIETVVSQLCSASKPTMLPPMFKPRSTRRLLRQGASSLLDVDDAKNLAKKDDTSSLSTTSKCLVLDRHGEAKLPKVGSSNNLRDNVLFIRGQMAYPEHIKSHEVLTRAADSLGIHVRESLPLMEKAHLIAARIGRV